MNQKLKKTAENFYTACPRVPTSCATSKRLIECEQINCCWEELQMVTGRDVEIKALRHK